MCIVDIIHVGNNDWHRFEELHNIKEHKSIWVLVSITPHGLNEELDFTVKTNR